MSTDHGHYDLVPSYAQERMWVISQMNPGSPLYNVPIAIRIKGQLSSDGLRTALERFVARHELLRSCFVEDEGKGDLIQRVFPHREVPWETTDLGADSEEARSKLREFIAQEALRPVDPVAGPILRAHLFQLSDFAHVLLVSVHHIVWDGRSGDILVRELAEFHDEAVLGVERSIEEPEVQYGDYAAWQRAWLGSGALDDHLAYWKDYLSGAPSLLDLPTDRPRPREQSHRGGLVSMVAQPGLWSSVQAKAREARATPFMVTLAGWKALLHRYSGMEDFLVGVLTSDRDRAELNSMVGLFVNTIPLRARVEPTTAFDALFQQVRSDVLDALSHQKLPLERLVEELQPVRSLAHHPLFQAVFAYEEGGPASCQRSGVSFELEKVSSETAKFDLSLTVVGEQDGLSAHLEYNADIFDRSTAERVLSHYFHLLEAALRRPDLPTGRLSMAPHDEAELVQAWGTGETRPVPSVPVFRHIEEIAETTPDSVAVLHPGNGQLTYGELNNRANRLARHLGEQGIGAGSRVGICLDPGPDLAVAVLGVLKSGAAFLPMDPGQPVERLRFLREETGCPLIITGEPYYHRCDPGASVLLLANALACVLDGSDLESGAEPSAAAYLIYTSGSTGKPKASVISHRNLANFVTGAVDRFGLGAEDKVLQLSPFSFDVFVEEVFPIWSVGGAVVFPPHGFVLDTPSLFSLVEQTSATVCELTTAYWNSLAVDGAEELEQVPNSLRLLLVGGDRPNEEAVRSWSRTGVPVANVYGLTETSVTTTSHLERWQEARARTGELPIGTPWPNTRVHVLDPCLSPVSIGIKGEIHIGGDGVGWGYLNQPGLTADRFLPDPFSPVPGGRLYRTGDVARYREDGTLELLGRADHQVKVRGFRIEPGEVESVLEAHPGVSQTLVIGREDRLGDQKLVAYLVLTQETGPSVIGEVRAEAERALPSYMVPSVFVPVHELPRGATGKLDRSALPAPEAAEAAPEDVPEAMSPVEAAIARIWSEALGGGEPGVYENFFELGGHSLLLTRIVARIRESLGVRVGFREVMGSPTVAGLAEIVERKM